MGKPLISKQESLKAFGLYIRGDCTFWEIAQQLPGLVQRNPSTASANARTRVYKGWDLVRHLARWKYQNQKSPYPHATLPEPGARVPIFVPPEEDADKPLTSFDQLVMDIDGLALRADAEHLTDAARALRNLAAAMRWNARKQDEAPQRPRRHSHP